MNTFQTPMSRLRRRRRRRQQGFRGKAGPGRSQAVDIDRGTTTDASTSAEFWKGAWAYGKGWPWTP
jgi:hypothetical protein